MEKGLNYSQKSPPISHKQYIEHLAKPSLNFSPNKLEEKQRIIDGPLFRPNLDLTKNFNVQY